MTTKSAALCLLLAFLVSVSALPAQDAAPPQKPPAKSAAPASPNAQNMDAYIKLLRKDVRSQKSEVMSEVMQLDPDQAAKFWPIYRDYDAELSKVNVVRGTAYPFLTGDYQVKGSSRTERSAKRLIGGAGPGAAIGGIAGNAGKGAAIGATAGAVGSVVQKGKSVQVPSETLLEFRLQQPASLPA